MKTIKPQTEKKIEKILWKLNEAWNIRSPLTKLEQGLTILHKRIEQVNKKIKNSTQVIAKLMRKKSLLTKSTSLTKKQVKENTGIIAKFAVQLLLLILLIGIIIYALP